MNEEQMRQALNGKFFFEPTSRRKDIVPEPVEEVIEPAPAEAAPEADVQPPPFKVPVALIVDAVSRAHDLEPSQLMSKPVRGSRLNHLVQARYHLCWMLKKLRPDVSLTRIALRLNYADHTTVLYGVRKFETLKNKNRQRMATAVEYIQNKTGVRIECATQ